MAVPCLYRAHWIVPMNGPPIEDGALLVDKNRIIAVDTYRGLRQRCPDVFVNDSSTRVFLPPLVNGHCHLELSCLRDLGETWGDPESLRPFPEWVQELISRRSRVEASAEERRQHARRALDHLWQRGVGLVADIGNDPASVAIGAAHFCRVQFFLEILGLDVDVSGEETHLCQLGCADDLPSAAHAPYSLTPSLLRKLCLMARRHGRTFPIHVAESAEEIDFLCSAEGGMARFLESRGVWRRGRQALGKGCLGAVDYLKRQGILGAGTLCVHAVHLRQEEIGMLAQSGAAVCLCPGSNRTLGVGKAAVEKLLAAGILPALGTDSLASNPFLDIWQEMRILRQDHPGLGPAQVLSMATIGGANALGVAGWSGFLCAGASPRFLAVSLPAGISFHDPGQLLEFLTSGGEAVEVDWCGPPFGDAMT